MSKNLEHITFSLSGNRLHHRIPYRYDRETNNRQLTNA